MNEREAIERAIQDFAVAVKPFGCPTFVWTALQQTQQTIFGGSDLNEQCEARLIEDVKEFVDKRHTGGITP